MLVCHVCIFVYRDVSRCVLVLQRLIIIIEKHFWFSTCAYTYRHNKTVKHIGFLVWEYFQCSECALKLIRTLLWLLLMLLFFECYYVANLSLFLFSCIVCFCFLLFFFLLSSLSHILSLALSSLSTYSKAHSTFVLIMIDEVKWKFHNFFLWYRHTS